MQFTHLPQNAVPEAIADRLKVLLTDTKVAWLVSGGSNIAIQVATINHLVANSADLTRLTILLNDERFGPSDHPDSNWFQLKQAGFMIDGPTYIAPYTDQEIALGQAVARYELIISDVLNNNYSFSQLGMGDDGHIAGLLPGCSALNAKSLTFGYNSQPYQRLTTTQVAITQFNEVVLAAYGESKWPQLQRLESRINPTDQPAQIIKDIPLVTIYTDYKSEIDS